MTTTKKTIEIDTDVALILEAHKKRIGYKRESDLYNRILRAFAESLEINTEDEIPDFAEL